MSEFSPAKQPCSPLPSQRLSYVAPALVELGELRDITLGASPGVGDSGGTQPQRCPGCP